MNPSDEILKLDWTWLNLFNQLRWSFLLLLLLAAAVVGFIKTSVRDVDSLEVSRHQFHIDSAALAL